MIINTSVMSQSNNATPARDTGMTGSGNSMAKMTGNDVSSDSVTLSETARLIAGLTTATPGHPEPDRLRISEIKQQINAGTFTADADRIATRFQQFTLNLQQETAHA